MLTLYSIALFLHIVGALGLFVALGLEWASLFTLRGLANTREARGWANLIVFLPRSYSLIWTAILFPGIYLTWTVWGWRTAWIVVSLAIMTSFPLLGAAVSGPRLHAIRQLVIAENGELPAAFHEHLHHPFLWASIHVRVALALGIIFLMTIKPSWSGALVSMGLATLLGLASIVPILRSRNE